MRRSRASRALHAALGSDQLRDVAQRRAEMLHEVVEGKGRSDEVDDAASGSKRFAGEDCDFSNSAGSRGAIKE